MSGPMYETLWKLRRHFGTFDDIGCLRELLARAIDRHSVDSLLLELGQAPALRKGLSSSDARRWYGGTRKLEDELLLQDTGRGRAIFLYVTTRILAPAVVVETGCFTGFDSAVILQALALNGRGHLYSIDLPAEEGLYSQRPGTRSSLPSGLAPGFLVADELRDRWTLKLADVRDELPPLLEKLGEIGVFFHDSDHTYNHMMWEYTTAWPYIADDGVIVSDDISWNTAFWDFARGVGGEVVVHRRTPNVGGIRAVDNDGRRRRSIHIAQRELALAKAGR
jgi:predicted O-methyltransferase YrrM